jgi:hypothetical protein
MECNHDHGKARLLATCPACQKKVFLHQVLQIESEKLQERSAGSMITLTMLHGTKPNRHALTLFIDNNMKVRGTQVSSAVIVSRK